LTIPPRQIDALTSAPPSRLAYGTAAKMLGKRHIDVGASVKAARRKLGMSQAALADEAGCSRHAIWELEKQGSGTVTLLARVFDAVGLRFTRVPEGQFGAALKTLRLARGLSQERLAISAGLSVPTVLRLESGNARIDSFCRALAVLAPRAGIRKNHGLWGGLAGYGDTWLTTPKFARSIERVFRCKIDLDPCHHSDAAFKPRLTFDESDDGLVQAWRARNAYANPPFSNLKPFVEKAQQEWLCDNCPLIAVLVPQHSLRTEAVQFANLYADIIVMKGAMVFDRPNCKRNRIPAPFGCALLLFGADEEMLQRAKKVLGGMLIRARLSEPAPWAKAA
jgi:transcriptional regulator with XRE-family HTH domain